MTDSSLAFDLSIVIVNYNGGALLNDCLESVFNETHGITFEVIIVDNNSKDGSPDLVQAHFPAVRIVRNSQNVGFARANNQGIEVSTGRYISLLNPDTIIEDNALQKLVRFAAAQPNVGAVGCKLVNWDGSLQYSMSNFPGITSQLFEALFLHRLFPRLTPRFGEIIYDRDLYDRKRKVDWVSGAAMVMSRRVLFEVELFDPDYFLYAEEVDLCYRIAKSGYDNYFYPDAQIVHHCGEFKVNPDLLVEDVKSRMRFYGKHYSPLKVAGFRLTTYLHLLVRIVTYSSARIAFKDERASIRLDAYRRGLRKLYARGGRN